MRTVFEIPHSVYKITIFNWNEKYILEIENGPFKQSFKIPVENVSSEDKVKEILDEKFLNQLDVQFQNMHDNFRGSLFRNEL